MRSRSLTIAAGLAFASGPALADYDLCVRLAGPGNYTVNVQVGASTVWTPIYVQGMTPACVRFSDVGEIRARSVYANPVRSCGTVAPGNADGVNVRANISEYVENKESPVQVTMCTRI